MTTVVGAPQVATMLGQWVRGGTLPEDLFAGLAELIDAGMIAAGSLMPPQRQLAAAIGVSRGTVFAAYGQLDARGYVTSRQGSGCRVRSRGQRLAVSDGRLFSFTRADADLLDLSSGALPASHVARELLREPYGDAIGPYLETDGYFPAGLPVLRSAIAHRLTRDGMPTRPTEILVTSGAQQGTWLAFMSCLGSGDLALVEEPTYRGALSALAAVGARVEGIPWTGQGVDSDLVRRGAGRGATLVYVQTSIHNPTGRAYTAACRHELASSIAASGMTVVEDCSSYDLTLRGPATRVTLATHAPPQQLIMIGTLSKLFWGGLRVGWLRADPQRIRGMTEMRKATDLAVGVGSQLRAADMLAHSDQARRERRQFLARGLAVTQRTVHQLFPHWSWLEVHGGPGLWIDTHCDTVALAESARRLDILLAPGPGFSVYGGFRSHLRLPLWHDEDSLNQALRALAAR